MTKEKYRSSFYIDKEVYKEFKKKCLDMDVAPNMQLEKLILQWLETFKEGVI